MDIMSNTMRCTRNLKSEYINFLFGWEHLTFVGPQINLIRVDYFVEESVGHERSIYCRRPYLGSPPQQSCSIPQTARAAQNYSFKNRTGDRTGEAVGSGFYWSDHGFIDSMSGF
jgi:hypothetical protein